MNQDAMTSWAIRQNQRALRKEQGNFAVFAACAMLLILFGFAALFIAVGSGWLP